MFIIYVRGTAFYGKVDATPSGVHIATKFYHVMFLPIVPLESVVVLNADRTIKAPFNFKSTLVGYLRSACFVAGTLGLAIGIMNAAREQDPDMVTAGFAALFGVGLLFFAMGSYYMPGIGIATPARARSIDAYLNSLVREAVAEDEARSPRLERDLHGGDPNLDQAMDEVKPRKATRRGTARAASFDSEPTESSSDEPFTVNCPTCGQELKFRPRMIGKTTNCPACQNPIQVEES